MVDTRQQVLESIRAQQQATVASLAEALGLSPIAVRHHLNTLLAQGLIKAELVRGGVGRPRHIYALTEAAVQSAPQRYHRLAERLLDELKATLPAEDVRAMIDHLGAQVVARYGPPKKDAPLELRLERLLAILGQEGFHADIQRSGERLLLAEFNCPYVYVGQRHPEVCRIDRAMIESILGVGVERTNCLLNGDTQCAFSIEAFSVENNLAG
jgi:DeoR family suf operon transcriptional repressor